MAVNPSPKAKKKKNVLSEGVRGTGTVLTEPAEMNPFKLWHDTFGGGQFLIL